MQGKKRFSRTTHGAGTYNAAVDEGRELPQPISEGLPDGREGQDDVKVSPHAGKEVGVQLRLGHLHGSLAVNFLRERPHRLYVRGWI